MKIIATIGEKELMCQINISELALLMGYRSVYDIPARTITIGLDLPLTKIAQTSEYVRTMDKESLSKIREHLQDALISVQEASDVVEGLSVFEILKEDHV